MDEASRDRRSRAGVSRGWVLVSSSTSVIERRISALALMEIPLSVGLLYLATCFSSFPWLFVLGVLGVPILLLRSDRAARTSSVLFKRYLSGRVRGSSERNIMIALVWLSGVVLLSCLASVMLRGRVGLWLIFPSLLFGFVAAFIAFVLGIASASMGVSMSLVGAALGIALSSATNLGVLFAGPGAALGACLGVMLAVAACSDGGEIPIWPIPAIQLGAFLRITAIELWSVAVNWRDGLIAFPENLQQIAFCMDIGHLPGFFSDRHVDLSVRSLINQIRTRSHHQYLEPRGRIGGHVFALSAITIIFASQMLYRLNIKASVLIWGPVAVVLRPVLWLDDEEMRSNTAYWTTPVVQYGLLSLAIALGAWLLTPFLPADLAPKGSSWLQSVISITPTPHFGLRYILLSAVTISFFGLIHSAYRIRSAHTKLFESAAELKNYPTDPLGRVHGMARSVRQWLQLTIGLLIIIIWVMGLFWSMARWPEAFSGPIWNHIRALL